MAKKQSYELKRKQKSLRAAVMKAVNDLEAEL